MQQIPLPLNPPGLRYSPAFDLNFLFEGDPSAIDPQAAQGLWKIASINPLDEINSVPELSATKALEPIAPYIKGWRFLIMQRA